MFRAFFPDPRLFFPAALAWAIICMAIWFLAGDQLGQFLSIAPWVSQVPTEANPAPFLTEDRVWLYQFVIMSGYLFCIPWYWIGGNRRWFWWSVVGSVTIVEVVFFDVQIGAWMNAWYGEFYNLIQAALTEPGSVPLERLYGELWTVAYILIPRIAVLVLNLFFIAHYLFRWRRAMTFFYMTYWPKLRDVEGASQRIQEDTQRFANIVEGLAVAFIGSIMTLLVFLPLLWTLSQNITELPLIGPVNGSLVWVALISAAFGTVLLGLVGYKLPGLEFQNQRVEAAFRKELVYGEDHAERASPPRTRDFFKAVQKNYFRLYGHYLYFNVARMIYLQGANFIPLIAMSPTIAAGALTFGLFQQVSNAFNQVENSFQFLANSWTTIISLISVYKRLRTFESHIPYGEELGVDYDDPRFLGTVIQYPTPDEALPTPQNI